ncbi:hypothetical protein [Mariniblastus fucicola]|uniref:Uncharacterized protein n=1 Tax=Mariniblastus fucicola TaxID=980251 RepID=A0A5B9P306_9BACT|nr:hypothetical protein [Mariniblastus fucicola]QEG20917.1 hypothetical protein MFFC18_07680 [Mariniblastus fucicola]
MKTRRSFSLLTFLMLATIAAIAVALYQANNEVADTRQMFKTYSHEMGFMDVDDNSKLHTRRLGGYPQMSFAFRYHLPEKQIYRLHVGSGVLDPDTGRPPDLLNQEVVNDESQGTLVVSLQQMLTSQGVRWTVQVIDEQTLNSTVLDDPHALTWIQVYLAAFPTDGQLGSPARFMGSTPQFVEGHEGVLVSEPDDTVVLYQKSEFHPSAVASVPPELMSERQVFMIWLEPVDEGKPANQQQSGKTTRSGSR